MSSRVQRCWVAAARREEVERAVWPVLVVVAAVNAEHVLEVAAAEDEDSVEAISAESADPALGVSVRVRRLDRRVDHPDALTPEDLVEGAAELRVAVVDEKPERLLVAEPHDQVARLLGDPAAVRSRRAGDVLDPPRRERDEEEDVDPLQKGGFDGEEVAGEHARRLRSQEGSPRRVRSLWRRLQTCLEQHLAHGNRRNRNTETLELADDPLVSPVRVLVGETKDQLAERALERRAPSGSGASMSTGGRS